MITIPIAVWMTIDLQSPRSPREFCNPFLARSTRVIADVRPGSGPFFKALSLLFSKPFKSLYQKWKVTKGEKGD